LQNDLQIVVALPTRGSSSSRKWVPSRPDNPIEAGYRVTQSDIMIVDDNPANLKLFEECLWAEGMTCRLAIQGV